ncbi:MAG: hypothetical protein H6Q33_3560 [Deltaproteobacteria bacterium]|jgi:hypothetical protein|nr:hypothetical protein [Deltaproteobacteria bacterium]
MDGVLVLAMVTLAEVIVVTLAEIVQAYRAWGDTLQPQRRHEVYGHDAQYGSTRRPANRTIISLLPSRRLGPIEEGCR